jgi:hypothetical protein
MTPYRDVCHPGRADCAARVAFFAPHAGTGWMDCPGGRYERAGPRSRLIQPARPAGYTRRMAPTQQSRVIPANE